MIFDRPVAGVLCDGRLKHAQSMVWTQLVRHLSPSEHLRVQLIELLPQRIHAATIELSSVAIVAQKFTDMLLAQPSCELDKLNIMARFDADRFEDVDYVVD
jgi:hypothetical protein